ncbi:MAG TPA: hypothetical protein VNN99_03080 [Vicinamibacterales bacterium]|nr:hypothetical protein [Vicinamibacterales bacterium]
MNYKRVALACLAALAEETAAHDKTRAQLQALRDELSRYTRAQVRRA